MEKREYSLAELAEIVSLINVKYYVTDIWEIKDSFYKYTLEELLDGKAIVGYFYINILIGDFDELDKIHQFVEKKNVNNEYDYLIEFLHVINPKCTNTQLKNHLKTIENMGIYIRHLTLTVGRPTVLNGFRDFSFYGPMLEKRKDIFVNALHLLYGDPAEAIYNVARAEYMYQSDDCLKAMLNLVEQIPVLEKAGDNRILYVALCLQMKLLVVNGEARSAGAIVNDIQNKFKNESHNGILVNIEALRVRVAIYEGNFDIVRNWMETKAPDECGNFNMLFLYQFIVKIRCYIMTEKYMAGVYLADKLQKLLKIGKRYMDLCELNILLSIGAYKAGIPEESHKALERALELARKYNYYRVIADEGEPILKVLNSFKKANPDYKYNAFLNKIITITKKTAVLYPNYLLQPYAKQIILTFNEKSIIQYLSKGFTYDEISFESNISINTVRYHIKQIYKKLEVNSASEAVSRAKSLNLL